jgi:benzylsuccinate CoA-transferase BbsF subunit
MRASNNYMDHSVGNNVAYALLLALYQRNRTGKGMRIDLTMLETGVSAIGPAILEAQRGIKRSRLGCSHLWKAPHNVYPCRGDDRWIAIVVSDDWEWQLLKQAMGNPTWAEDYRFDSVLGRWKHRHELDGYLSGWTATQDDLDLMRELQNLGIRAGAALTAQDLVNDPHLKERSYFLKFHDPRRPEVGPRVFAGRPFRIPGIPMEIHSAAALGEHNEEILRDVSGLSKGEIDELAREGVIFTSPKPEEPAP